MTRGVLLDISGVLIEGGTALPGAAEAVSRLREAGLPLRFLTNTTRKPQSRVLADLAAAGIEAGAEELLTPAQAARRWLAEHGCHPHLLVHPALAEDFADGRTDGPTAVVVGDAGAGFTYEAMNAAFRELADGAPFLALAANRVFRDADGALSMDAGGFVHALEYASGTEPVLLGKPAPGFFAAAAESIGAAPGDLVMIGDDAEADVAGALAAGIGKAFLVRTGKYRDGDEKDVDPAPTAILDDIGEAVGTLLS